VGVLFVEFGNGGSYSMFASGHSGLDMITGWGWFAFSMLRHLRGLHHLFWLQERANPSPVNGY